MNWSKLGVGIRAGDGSGPVKPSVVKLPINIVVLTPDLTTLQPLYNMVCYNMVLDITRFKDGSKNV